ncbi:hypothetical protein L4923_09565 [Mesorhizobium sp. IRAMC:0171]|uniref:DUF4345 domain-containing protein n=2 Tax=Mesorhizobium retamae TaxID=2912854 RepID=A0ABS9QCY0_9HYPH|nr:hypothetical protein [Mesorhizobium sp. IRAMC:0171]MCG7505267.1 hypothetical protein [Mesorhizobium sp. IRAMC:0171]
MRLALPTLPTALFGALTWAFLMGTSAFAKLWMAEWQTPGGIVTVVLLFAAGAALAFPLGLYTARLISLGRSGEVAFAALFACLLAATLGFTAGLYVLQYRSYYAEWHGTPFSVRWFLQFAFTSAGALYQFAILGIRFYFPLGFIALFAAGLWFVRQPR